MQISLQGYMFRIIFIIHFWFMGSTVVQNAMRTSFVVSNVINGPCAVSEITGQYPHLTTNNTLVCCWTQYAPKIYASSNLLYLADTGATQYDSYCVRSAQHIIRYKYGVKFNDIIYEHCCDHNLFNDKYIYLCVYYVAIVEIGVCILMHAFTYEVKP